MNWRERAYVHLAQPGEGDPDFEEAAAQVGPRHLWHTKSTELALERQHYAIDTRVMQQLFAQYPWVRRIEAQEGKAKVVYSRNVCISDLRLTTDLFGQSVARVFKLLHLDAPEEVTLHSVNPHFCEVTVSEALYRQLDSSNVPAAAKGQGVSP